MTTTTPETGTTIIEEPRTDVRPEHGDHERFAHYVEKDKLAEAYVMGTPVRALCGKMWVPSRDPSKFPVCPECKELYEMGPAGRAQFWRDRESSGGGSIGF